MKPLTKCWFLCMLKSKSMHLNMGPTKDEMVMILGFIPCPVLILPSDWLTTIKFISCLTSLAWDIRKGMSLMTCLYGDLGQINGMAEILKLWICLRMWQTSFWHVIDLLLCVCFCRYRNLSTLSIAIPHLRCCVWINSHIHISKQGVANNLRWEWVLQP